MLFFVKYTHTFACARTDSHACACARMHADQVLYPCINVNAYDREPSPSAAPALAALLQDHPTFVSINRFERKKNIGLALEALAWLRRQRPRAPPAGPEGRGEAHVVLAGGYDPRVRENVEYMDELKDLAARLDIQDQVRVRACVSNTEGGAGGGQGEEKG